jgi:hypothetical protein
VSRSETPTLHQLIDEVAVALETRPVDLVVIDDDYNAAWSIVGVRRGAC